MDFTQLTGKPKKNIPNKIYTLVENLLVFSLIFDLMKQKNIILSIEHDGLIFLYDTQNGNGAEAGADFNLLTCSNFRKTSRLILNFEMPIKTKIL